VVMPIQTEQVRAANRLAVYRALAASSDLTRAEVALATQLSLPTVSSILAELQELGLIAGAGLESATGGRPARRLRFVSDAHFVLAVDLSGRRAHACRIDLRGEVVASFEGPILAPGATPALLEWLGPLVDAGAAGVSRLALAVPGVVDPIDGHVDLAPALGWHDHDVAEAFASALGVDVVLENDVNALALAELHYGAGAARRHVLYVAIGSGVGAGLVIDGRLYRGAHAAAGELGYSLPLTHGGDDRTPPATAPEAVRGADAGPLERALLATARGCLDAEGVLDLSLPGAADAFDRFVDMLRGVLHNLACVLDPELLVVAWSADPDGLLAARLRGTWQGPWPLPIAAGTVGAHAAARGVAWLALERLAHEVCRSRGDTAGRAETAPHAPTTPDTLPAAPGSRRPDHA
jgi:predicted NBD/HSP70 family sugar kinase